MAGRPGRPVSAAMVAKRLTARQGTQRKYVLATSVRQRSIDERVQRRSGTPAESNSSSSFESPGLAARYLAPTSVKVVPTITGLPSYSAVQSRCAYPLAANDTAPSVSAIAATASARERRCGPIRPTKGDNGNATNAAVTSAANAALVRAVASESPAGCGMKAAVTIAAKRAVPISSHTGRHLGNRRAPLVIVGPRAREARAAAAIALRRP